jgi:group I intron endonuclease
MESGIYKITNKITQKVYIGLSSNIKSRFRHHRYYLNHSIHSNPYLQKAWDKYGEENFTFEVVEYCEKEVLQAREGYWCELFNVHDLDFGYNLRSSEEAGFFKHSEETKIKMSESKTGNKNSFYGKKHSTETKKKQSNVKLGKTMSDSMKEKRRRYQKENNWKPSDSMIEKSKKAHYRPIVQLTKTGEYVQEFNGPADALRELGLSQQTGHISTTCKGQRLLCGGYSWMYKEDYLNPEKLRDRLLKLSTAVIHKN